MPLIRHGQQVLDAAAARLELRHGLRVRANLLFLEIAHVLLQVAHAVGGRIAVVAVDGAVHEAEHAQPQLQLLDFLAGRALGQHRVLGRDGVLGEEEVLRREVGDSGLLQVVVVLEDAHGPRRVASIDAVGLARPCSPAG